MSNWMNPIPEVGGVEGEDQLVAVEADRLRHELHVGETPVLAKLVHLQPAVYSHSHFVDRINVIKAIGTFLQRQKITLHDYHDLATVRKKDIKLFENNTAHYQSIHQI